MRGGDESVKHNRSPSGTKEERSQGPQEHKHGVLRPWPQGWDRGGPCSPCMQAALRG